ncbi:thioredoxin domain-containing protein [Flavobacteriaceae bacterium]|nr:thioredoxin domain-containing protein [Flavobacteriaceae bacterium]
MKIKLFYFFFLLLIITACQNKESKKMSNNLINETSPYLLQHAYNPVDWNPWDTKYLEIAKQEKKLVIISVGYSACHWCHVMERESFEDTIVAKLMNEKFISIKVDREERPDVDNVYMNAVQLMTGSGGWPLNVITLPDGRPIWGGTYFSKEQWINALDQVSKLYEKDPERLISYADQLEEGVKSLDFIELNDSSANFNLDIMKKYLDTWSKKFDLKYGGAEGMPKFMMPSNLHFLLKYSYQTNNLEIQNFVNLSLKKMAFGGIYDQIGGGFSRYSVDNKWHVPHFEKMLYDNAQLVSLYSDAYKATKNELYKKVVYETIEFVNLELKDDSGGYYSSLDADSKTTDNILEEGAFYVWTEDELKTILNEDFTVFSSYYNINPYGYWEDGKYVLIRNEDDQKIAEKHNLSIAEIKQIIKNCNSKLIKVRSKRAKPRLDDKILTSWNGLMIKGFVDSYKAFNEPVFLEAAIKNGEFILKNVLKKDGQLLRNYKNDKSYINGYLEDYSATISGFLSLHEVTLDEKWLKKSKEMTEYVYDHFYNENTKMFYFTSDLDEKLLSRTVDFRDDVIPSSNSIMANNLFLLSHYFDEEKYLNTATTMLNNISPELDLYPNGFSNWLNLMLKFSDSFYEVAVIGENALVKVTELNKNFKPNKLIIGSLIESDLPLLENRYVDNDTYIYVCVKKACRLPVKSSKEALEFID